jgi:two-component system OmpR family sensor kinase
MALLTLMMLVFCFVLYDRLFSDLYSQLDSLLQSRAAGVTDAIDTYWEVEKLEASREGADERTFKKAGNINFVKIAQRWVNEESNKPDLLNIIVQIFDARGRLIASSKNIGRSIIFPDDLFQTALLGQARFDTVAVPFGSDSLTILRVFTKPVVEADAVTYIVQVASPLTALENVLGDLRHLLTVMLPLLILFTGLIGMILAKLSLRPVDRMIKAVQQITAQSLRQRIPEPDTRDEIQRLAVTFNDMLARLDRSFASQRHFLQDASHELKTPLTILEGEMSVALKRQRSPEEYEGVLRSCLEEIERLTRIVHNLLTLARLDDREIALQRQSVDLAALACSVLEDMQVLADQKAVSLACKAAEALSVVADEQFMRQVLINIISNAVKYTPEGGAVSVDVLPGKGSVAVIVRDTGIGIKAEDIPFIFDRFYRVEASRSSAGFGLGLSIAKSIVEAHGGTISLQSVPGQGSTFTITLPVH